MNTNKILVLLTIGIFIVSSIGGFLGAGDKTTVVDLNDEAGITNFSMSLAKPIFKQIDGFVEVTLEEQTSSLISDGKPELPVITKVFTFPVGTLIKNVDVNIDRTTYTLDEKVIPSPIAVPLNEINYNAEEEYTIDEDFYETNELYPIESYTVKTAAGLANDEHSTYLIVKTYVQYSSMDDEIYVPEKIQIDLEYEEPEETLANAEQYDLIIITHEKFEQALQPLVDHKNNLNPPMKTIMVTVQDIYDQYEGRADWEEIKMYLADHVLDWDVKYVLLAGGHVGQTQDWYVPDFRSHNSDPSDTEYDPPYDVTYSADLYFADVYYVDTYGQHVMDDWDSNGNGVCGEGPVYNLIDGKDDPDLIPDVAVGRLPFRYSWEVPIAVNKIINYENNADDSWYKTALLAGGDGFPPERYGGIADPDAWEGEIVCDAFADLLSNKDIVSTKCYCSDQGDVQVTDNYDIINTINSMGGCGWVHLTGHASPVLLGSYTPGTGISPPPIVPFYNTVDIRQWDNEGLPFMICEGCHNAQFDVTFQNLIDWRAEDNPNFFALFGREEWLPHDASSWFVLVPGGGAIGIIGNTGLGLGGLNYGCTRFVGGWIMLRFAHAYAIQNKEYTGTVWAQGVTDYIVEFDCSSDWEDRKTAEERVLLGDPSVKLGGYGGSLADSEENQEEENIIPVSVQMPTWELGDTWTYNVDTIDLNYDGEVEGRTYDIKLSSGDIKMEITGVSANTYTAEISSDDIDVSLGLYFDFYNDELETIQIPSMSFENISLTGEMVVDKDTLAIENIQVNLVADIMDNIDNLPIELPNIVQVLKPFISIPANIELNIDFENPFKIIDFPLNTGDVWTIEQNTVTVSIGGSVESIWLKILNVINKFVKIIPEDLAKYLPNVDIAEVLNDFGIQTEYTIEIPEGIPTEWSTASIFETKGASTINVPAGNFNAALVSILEENGQIYFSEEVNNVVKVTSPISDYIGIFDDINIELISTNQ